MASSISKLLLGDLISQCNTVPQKYIIPVADRPNLCDENSGDDSANIPVIDLKGLAGANSENTIKSIALACQNYGFFQVKNHGIPNGVIDGMLQVSKEFFHLPELERAKLYSDDTSKTVRLSTSFNVKSEKIGSWRDYLRLHCHPLHLYIHQWPSNPPTFKEVVGEYCKNVRELSLKLLEAISESLGVEKKYIVNALGEQAQHMAINYYPPCPQPELTYGLPAHKDPNAITILLQDGVSGLQILRDGKWVHVNSPPGTLLINIGDQIQVLSNDRYKSVVHRAIVNNRIERFSVPTFYCPSPNAVMKPAESLVDEEHPALYRSFTYKEYYHHFWNRGLEEQSCLDIFKSTIK